MRGLGSAALAAAKIFSGVQSGKTAGQQRAREEATAARTQAEEERRAMLDEMVKRSAVAQNEAQTGEITKRTAALPGSWSEVLEREAAKGTSAQPRNIDPLSEPGIDAAARRAAKIAGATAPYQKATQPRADPSDTDARLVERDRRAYVATRSREILKNGEARNFTDAKVTAEAEAKEIYGTPKQIGDPHSRPGDPVPEPQGETSGVGGVPELSPEQEQIAAQAVTLLKSGQTTIEQVRAHKWHPNVLRAIERAVPKRAPPPGQDRF